MTAINQATKLYYGGAEASAAYVGSNKVWPVFKPTDIAGCAIWLDASKLNLTDGANVTTWTNLGSGSQPVITSTPKFRTNALNKIMPCVRFNRGAGKLRMAGTGVDKDYTIVYVGRKWDLSAPGRVVAAIDPSNILIGFHGYEGDVSYIEGWITNAQAPPATTLWKLYSADSTSTAVARFFNNGFLSASGAATPAKGFAGSLCISGYGDSPDVAVSQETNCEIAELVMYNRKLSDAERSAVERYLRAKWMAPIWNPSELRSNINAWFDSSNIGTVQVSGSAVNNWFSSVGTAVASQATAVNMPPYWSAGGVNCTLNCGLFGQNLPSQFDVLVVAKPNPPAAAPVDWRTMLRSANLHEMIIENGTTRFGAYVTGGFAPAGGLTWGAVDGMSYARIAPSNPVVMNRDGGVMTSTVIALPASSAAPTIGFGCYGGTTTPSQGFGNVKEVIFVPYNSSDTIRIALEGYVAHKWGLTGLLPAGHLYKNLPPLMGAT